MNDDDLITALRAQRRKVPMTTPVEQIIKRSRAVRASRRIPVITGAMALAAGAAVAVTALLPASPSGSHQPSHPVHVQLAAWTVVKRADGTILVRIREFRDRAGLQRKLRADGVPVSVIFITSGQFPANPDLIPGNPCRQFNGDGNATNSRLLLRVANLVDAPAKPPKPGTRGGPDPFRGGVVIHPSALPRHVGLQLYITRNLGYSSPQNYGGMAYLEDLVQASPSCTGS